LDFGRLAGGEVMAFVNGRSPVIDCQARERAEGWLSELSEHIGKAELLLATLGGFCDEGLGQAIVGAMGLSVGEVREQIPALRQAVRDMEGEL
jgi:hypothetical protein